MAELDKGKADTDCMGTSSVFLRSIRSTELFVRERKELWIVLFLP
jgi:hypothetical protein